MSDWLFWMHRRYMVQRAGHVTTFGTTDEVAWPQNVVALTMRIGRAMERGDAKTARELVQRIETDTVWSDPELNEISRVELLSFLANMYVDLDDHGQALSRLEVTCEAGARVGGRRVRTAFDLRTLAQLRFACGDQAGGLRELDRAVGLLQQTDGFTPDFPLYQELVAMSLASRAGGRSPCAVLAGALTGFGGYAGGDSFGPAWQMTDSRPHVGHRQASPTGETAPLDQAPQNGHTNPDIDSPARRRPNRRR
jgi:hypothetical protein